MLEERVDILEATVQELREDINVVEDLADKLQIDVNLTCFNQRDLKFYILIKYYAS